MNLTNKETEWWWIDYMENELGSSLEQDLQALLQHSEADRDSFENFRILKQWLKESDPVGDWPLENRLSRVRKNVMAAIEKLDKPEPQRETEISETNVLSL